MKHAYGIQPHLLELCQYGTLKRLLSFGAVRALRKIAAADIEQFLDLAVCGNDVQASVMVHACRF